MRMTMSTRNAAAVAANLVAFDRTAQRNLRKAVRVGGTLTEELAFELCAVDTEWMRDHLRLTFSPDFLVYEVGWEEEDFTEAGLEFYPPLVEFGTQYMDAQPALFPANEAIRPLFLAEVGQQLSDAIRRHNRTTRRRR